MAIEDENVNCKIIVLDTTTYAGNFERQLCAYITCQLGDCEIGEELAKVANKELKHLDWWKENICPQESEEGSEFMRPCTLWQTEDIDKNKKTAYFSVAIFVENFPPQEVLNEMIDRAKSFCNDPAKIYTDNGLLINNYIQNNLNLTGYRFLDPQLQTILVQEKKVVGYEIKKINLKI